MANPPMPVLDRDISEKPFRAMLVKVTNGNDFALNDMYDGVQYVLEPGKETKMPAEAANHILGWTEGGSRRDMFLHTQKRWGWNTKEWSDKAERFFDKIRITHASFKLVEVPEGGDEAEEEIDTGGRGARRA